MHTNPRGVRLTMIALTVVVVVSAVVGVALLPQRQTPELGPRTARVEYRVTGDAAQAQITMVNDLGFIEERTVPVPWAIGFRAPAGRELRIMITRVGDTGAVGCEVASGGQPILTIAPDASEPTIECLTAVP